MSRSRSYSPGNHGGGRWTPFSLGASLIAWWDAERPDLVTQISGAVSSWTDIVAGYTLTQSNASLRPLYSSTVFNNRPGLVFDGTDDRLINAVLPAAFPTAANPSWIWGVVQQSKLDADATTGDVFQYGDNSSTQRMRRLARAQSVGTGRANATGGNAGGISSAISTATFNGRNVAVAKFAAANTIIGLNGVDSAPIAIANDTLAVRMQSGSAINGGDFFLGTINAILLTLPLSASNEALTYSYFTRRI